MTTYYCPECLEVEVSPNARDGRCESCRPIRRHSTRNRTLWQHEADQQYRQLVWEHTNR